MATVVLSETIKGMLKKSSEHKDAGPDELKVKEINTGTYCFDNESLFASAGKGDE